MNEKLLQFVWKHKLFNADDCFTIDGDRLIAHSPGMLNTNAGPDFSLAHIQLNDMQWFGDVEVHLKASDWRKHNHHCDRNYDKVVLHVVSDNDEQVKRTNGEIIPTIVLPVDEKIVEAYNKLLIGETDISCKEDLKKINSMEFSSWLAAVAVSRIEEKAKLFKDIHSQVNGDWEQLCFITFAKSFGFKVNSVPFELMAKSISYKIIAKHRDNLLQVEALLFGQAGMLEKDIEGDEYYNLLKKEYTFLKQKYSLKSIEGHLWKFLRTRPVNFPTIRIAQLAAIIHKTDRLFSKFLNIVDAESLKKMFQQRISDYWNIHYQFGKTSTEKDKRLGSSSVSLLAINAVAPLQFYYGIYADDIEYKDNALKLLESLKPESNAILNNWNEINITAKNALESQALLHLFNDFCQHRKCIECRIGNLTLLHSFIKV